MRSSATTARLCAACVKGRVAIPSSSSSSSVVSSRAYSLPSRSLATAITLGGTTQCRPPPNSNSNSRLLATTRRSPSARRWVSTSSPSSAPEPETATNPAEEGETASQTGRTLSYYALFPQTLPHGPPPSGPFHIDVRALRREFLRLQAAAHPDFHHSSSSASLSKEEQEEQAQRRRSAESASATINAAFRTLADPLLRAQYLLRERHGIDLAGDEAGASAAAEPELLLAVMEAREAIEAAGDEGELEIVRRENEARVGEAVEGLERAFDNQAGTGGGVEEMVRWAVRLRYWVNVRMVLDEWEPGKPVVLIH